MRLPASSLSLCILLACLSGCQDPPLGEQDPPPDEQDPPPDADGSERFDLVTDFEGPLCDSNLRHLEQRLAWLEDTFDLTVEGEIQYFWFEGEHTLCSSSTGGACAEGLTMIGPWMSADHELVHIVLGTLGRAKTFLEEGTAVAFSQDFILMQDPDPPSLWLDCDLRAPGEFNGPGCYFAAAHFIRFLIDRHGLDRFKELYAGSRYEDGVDEFLTGFESVYDQPFSAIEAEYLDTAYDVYPGMAGCGTPTIPLLGEPYSGEFSLRCGDDPEVLRVDATQMMRRVHFSLAEPASGAFLVDGEEAYVSHCAPEPYDVDTPPPPQGSFAAGIQTLHLSAPADSPTTKRVTFEPK